MISSTLLALGGLALSQTIPGASAPPTATPVTPAVINVPEGNVFDPGTQPASAAAFIEAATEELGPATSAYHRGLMPLPDYLDHIASVTVDGSPEAVRALRMGLMEDVVARLEAFRQPAAIGWAADLAEARYHLASAEGASDDVREQLADRAIALREADIRFGLASPADAAETIARVMPVDGVDEDRREALAERAQGHWATQVASGVGRADELLLARLRAGELTANEAGELSGQAFDLITQFHANGTASLYEATEAYTALETVAVGYTEGIPPTVLAGIESRREQLAELAAGTRDLRGRNEADVRLALRVIERSTRLTGAPERGGYDDVEITPATGDLPTAD